MADNTLDIIYSSITFISIVALSIITFYYLRETRLIRKVSETSLLPSFSFIPDSWSMSGGFNSLNIINTGGIAREISLDFKTTIESEQKDHKFYIVSLNQNALSNIPRYDISQINKLKVEISCKDINNKAFKETLSIDFEEIKKQNQEIIYQSDPLYSISETLKKIERKK